MNTRSIEGSPALGTDAIQVGRADTESAERTAKGMIAASYQ
jgi:hypothetical protein